jgi:hypothetical protein
VAIFDGFSILGATGELQGEQEEITSFQPRQAD